MRKIVSILAALASVAVLSVAGTSGAGTSDRPAWAADAEQRRLSKLSAGEYASEICRYQGHGSAACAAAGTALRSEDPQAYAVNACADMGKRSAVCGAARTTAWKTTH